MDIALSAVRLLLTVVFGIAAVAKLVDRASFRRALRDFGAPEGLVRPLRYAVPAAELAVAVALVLPVAAWWGAIAAAGMLLAFIAVIGWSLAHGRTPECNCFGRLSAGAIGRKTLVRNGILAALAGALVVAGPARSAASAVGWLGPLTPIRVAGLAGAVAVLALLSFEGWLLVNLVRQNSRLLTRVSALEAALETGAGHRTQLPLVPPSGQANGHRHHHGGERGLPRGDVAPAVRLPDLDGDEVDLADFRGTPVVLLFWSPNCGFCQRMLPDLKAWEAQRPADGPRLLVVSAGSAGRAYGATGTPQAVLIGPDGTVASPLAAGGPAVMKLMNTRLSPV